MSWPRKSASPRWRPTLCSIGSKTLWEGSPLFTMTTSDWLPIHASMHSSQAMIFLLRPLFETICWFNWIKVELAKSKFYWWQWLRFSWVVALYRNTKGKISILEMVAVSVFPNLVIKAKWSICLNWEKWQGGWWHGLSSLISFGVIFQTEGGYISFSVAFQPNPAKRWSTTALTYGLFLFGLF